ncbi:MAG: alpha/beta hydrolase [Anaerolineales bacterium]|nr:alpha/beta hydrolase [Anaerolineales bacterium]
MFFDSQSLIKSNTMSTEASMFKTPEGQARYFAAYDETLALWNVPIEAIEIETRFGTTHVNVCGSKDAPPLVLLPGAAISSTMWYPNAKALSTDYRLYAIDVIGDMGKSVLTNQLKNPSDYAEWLVEVLDSLQIKQTHVLGISLGGFLALNFTLQKQERVLKLILLSPATLLSIRPKLFFNIAIAIFVPFLSPKFRQELFLGMASPHSAPAIKQLFTPNDFQYKMFLPKVFRDEQLKEINVPTLLLLGEREVIYNPEKALKRAKRLIRNIEADIIPNAGHAINLDQPEIINQRILDFLKK